LSSERSSARPRAIDGVLLAASSFALFVALRQSRFYLIDGESFYQMVAHDHLRHYAHVLYLPLAGGLATLLELVGVPLFDA
jgi:hypothetical protein